MALLYAYILDVSPHFCRCGLRRSTADPPQSATPSAQLQPLLVDLSTWITINSSATQSPPLPRLINTNCQYAKRSVWRLRQIPAGKFGRP